MSKKTTKPTAEELAEITKRAEENIVRRDKAAKTIKRIAPKLWRASWILKDLEWLEQAAEKVLKAAEEAKAEAKKEAKAKAA